MVPTIFGCGNRGCFMRSSAGHRSFRGRGAFVVGTQLQPEPYRAPLKGSRVKPVISKLFFRPPDSYQITTRETARKKRGRRLRHGSGESHKTELNGWGTRIRTWVGGVRVRSPTARRSPSEERILSNKHRNSKLYKTPRRNHKLSLN